MLVWVGQYYVGTSYAWARHASAASSAKGFLSVLVVWVAWLWLTDGAASIGGTEIILQVTRQKTADWFNIVL